MQPTANALPRDPRAVLTVHQRRRFTVSAYRQVGRREFHEYTTHQLDSAATTRHHYGHLLTRPWVTRVVLQQHDVVSTTRNTHLHALEGEGRPTPLPALPDGAFRVQRYYRIAGYGPYALSTGDDVRELVEWMRRNRGHHPYNLTDIPDPDSIQLLETTQVSYQQEITVEDLADVPERRSIDYSQAREHALALTLCT